MQIDARLKLKLKHTNTQQTQKHIKTVQEAKENSPK